MMDSWPFHRSRRWAQVVLLVAFWALAPAGTSPRARAETEVGGPIISDTTWTVANSPYFVVESIDVWEGVTLTIEPGVTVKFEREKKMQVNGQLIARGTASRSIWFTSLGDIIGPGDWGNIEFTTTAVTTTMDVDGKYVEGSILQYCVVELAGYDWAPAIDARSLLVDHCTVQDNYGPGIWERSTADEPGRIANSTISGNHGGIYVEHGTVAGNVVSGNTASFGGGIYAVDSTVTDNAVCGNTATGFAPYEYGGGGIWAENSTVTGNTVCDNVALWFDGGGVYAENSTVRNNTVRHNMADRYGGGIYALDSTVADNTVGDNAADYDEAAKGSDWLVAGGGIYARNSTVSGNLVSGNRASGGRGATGGGIYAYETAVTGNAISGNWATTPSLSEAAYGGGVRVTGGQVLSNTIINNSVSGPIANGAGAYGGTEFLYNTVVGNRGPAGSTAGGVSNALEVHYNNMYGNEPYDVSLGTSSGLRAGEPYGVSIGASDDVSGTHNYWGPVSSVDILDQIYDWHDDASLRKFLYIPYLQEPDPNAPVPPPLNLTADWQGGRVVLHWDPIPSTTMGYGYKIYYDSDDPLPPYEGTGLDQGDSAIDVGDRTEYTLTGLEEGTAYYIAVTAYDTLGREGWYGVAVTNFSTLRLAAYLPIVVSAP
jgi:hypothetical protein